MFFFLLFCWSFLDEEEQSSFLIGLDLLFLCFLWEGVGWGPSLDKRNGPRRHGRWRFLGLVVFFLGGAKGSTTDCDIEVPREDKRYIIYISIAHPYQTRVSS